MIAGFIDLLKAATRASIAAAGGLEAAARLPGVRVGLSRLAHYQHPDRDRDAIPIDVAAALDIATGRPHHAETLARLAGGRFVAGRGGAVRSLAHALALHIRETGELDAEVAAALQDGELTAAERRRIIAEIRDARAALEQLEAAVVRRAR